MHLCLMSLSSLHSTSPGRSRIQLCQANNLLACMSCFALASCSNPTHHPACAKRSQQDYVFSCLTPCTPSCLGMHWLSKHTYIAGAESPAPSPWIEMTEQADASCCCCCWALQGLSVRRSPAAVLGPAPDAAAAAAAEAAGVAGLPAGEA